MRLICFSPVTSQNGNSVQEKKVIAQTVSVGDCVLACKYVLVLSYQTLDCRGVCVCGGGEVGKIRFFFFLWSPLFIRNFGDRPCVLSLSEWTWRYWLSFTEAKFRNSRGASDLCSIIISVFYWIAVYTQKNLRDMEYSHRISVFQFGALLLALFSLLHSGLSLAEGMNCASTRNAL